MGGFLSGVLASIVAAALIAIIVKSVWPAFQNRCLYNGIRVAGVWEIIEARNGRDVKVGKIELTQQGRIIKGTSTRKKTREGKDSERKFQYRGFIDGHQVTLIFEDKKGVGFDTGTYVFRIQNDGHTMVGMATFHGKRENKIVSEPRTLVKTLS